MRRRRPQCVETEADGSRCPLRASRASETGRCEHHRRKLVEWADAQGFRLLARATMEQED